jgi:hypothetical protein
MSLGRGRHVSSRLASFEFPNSTSAGSATEPKLLLAGSVGTVLLQHPVFCWCMPQLSLHCADVRSALGIMGGWQGEGLGLVR